MYLLQTVQFISALSAVTAAVLWFLSARVRTPESFSIHVVRSDSFAGQMLGGPLGGEYMGHGYSPGLNELAQALRKQSRLSGCGAIAAGISALLQAIAPLIS